MAQEFRSREVVVVVGEMVWLFLGGLRSVF